jgi:hypothetical protein
MLLFSKAQESALAYDVVRRHAGAQAAAVDARLRHRGAGAGRPTDGQRVLALAEVLKDGMARSAPAAAPHLRVDLDACARLWLRALEAGAAFRETAASAQMLACASLGLGWLSDGRFCAEATGPWTDTLPPVQALDPGGLKAWAEAGWAERYEHALTRMKALQAPGLYALDRAAAAQFDAASLRNLARTVFPVDQPERLAHFVAEERSLFHAAMRPGRGPLDPRLEAVCIAADLVHGQGRFVRLLVAMRQQTPVVDHPFPLLLKAIDELAG